MIVNSLMFREIKKVYPDIKIGLVARGAAIDIVKIILMLMKSMNIIRIEKN